MENQAVNKSGHWLYWLAAGLALAGLVDASYLTHQHLTGAHLQCTIVQGCAEVLGSSYAKIGPVPLAALGVAAYFTVFSLAVLAASGYRLMGKLLAAQVAAMFLVTLVLLYLQAFVIERFCQYCLLSAAVTFSLAVVVFFAQRAAARLR
jgi:uncharacterized membrane protein